MVVVGADVKDGIAMGARIEAESTDGCWEAMSVIEIDHVQCLRRRGPYICTSAGPRQARYCMPFLNQGRHDFGFKATTDDGAVGFFSYDDEGKIWRRL